MAVLTMAACSSSATPTGDSESIVTSPTESTVESSTAGPTPNPTKTSGWQQVSGPFTVTDVARFGVPVTLTAKVGEPLLLAFELKGNLGEGVGYRQSPDPDLLAPVIPTGKAAEQQKQTPMAIPMIATKAGRTALIIYALKDGKPDQTTAVGFEVTVTE